MELFERDAMRRPRRRNDRRRKRTRSDLGEQDSEVIVISSDDDVDPSPPSSGKAAAAHSVVTDDEQRLLDEDQELNDSVVNKYLQLIVDRFQRQTRGARPDDDGADGDDDREGDTVGTGIPQQRRRAPPVLVNVSTHFLPRWRSLWREIEEVHKTIGGNDSGAAVPPPAALDVGLAQRMRGWIGGRGLPMPTTPVTPASPAPSAPPGGHQMCLRHWIALYDIPMRHVYAPRQHSIDTRALLDQHLAGGCTQCFSSACVLFPVHVPKQHHWIMTALLIPRIKQWPPAPGGRMPLGKVHVYDSMLWLHHRYSRFYPFDDDDDEVAQSGPQSRATMEWMRAGGDDEDIINRDACDGRKYRRMLLHRTVRPLLAAVQLIAMHRILEAPNAASFVSTPRAPNSVSVAFPRLHRWRVRWHRYSVTQQNAVDCGVAVCKAADHIAQSLAKTASSALDETGAVARRQKRRRRKTFLREVDAHVGVSTGPNHVYRRHLFRAAADLHMLYWRRIERSDLREYRTTMHRWLFPQAVTVIDDDDAPVPEAANSPLQHSQDDDVQDERRRRRPVSAAVLARRASSDVPTPTHRRRRRSAGIEASLEYNHPSRRRRTQTATVQ